MAGEWKMGNMGAGDCFMVWGVRIWDSDVLGFGKRD